MTLEVLLSSVETADCFFKEEKKWIEQIFTLLATVAEFTKGDFSCHCYLWFPFDLYAKKKTDMPVNTSITLHIECSTGPLSQWELGVWLPASSFLMFYFR